MVKVEMPRADWEILLMILKRDYLHNGSLTGAMINDIQNQVYSQEY